MIWYWRLFLVSLTTKIYFIYYNILITNYYIMSNDFNSLYPTNDYFCNKEEKWSWNDCDVNVWREQSSEEIEIEVKDFLNDIL